MCVWNDYIKYVCVCVELLHEVCMCVWDDYIKYVCVKWLSKVCMCVCVWNDCIKYVCEIIKFYYSFFMSIDFRIVSMTYLTRHIWHDIFATTYLTFYSSHPQLGRACGVNCLTKSGETPLFYALNHSCDTTMIQVRRILSSYFYVCDVIAIACVL